MVSIERVMATEAAGRASEVVARTVALIPALRERAAAVDELRELLPATVADLKAAGTARLFQPARFGGCEAQLFPRVDALSPLRPGRGSAPLCLGPPLP